MHTAQRAKIGTPYLRLQEKTTLPNQFVFLISLHFFARIVCVGMIWRSLPNWFVFLIPFHSFRRIACVGITQIYPTDLFFIPFLSFRRVACVGALYKSVQRIYLFALFSSDCNCKPHLVAEETSPNLRIFANIQECDYAAQGSNVFFNCCLDKGPPRLSSQGQNPCKFRRLLMGLFSSWASCLQRFVSFDHCCILLE